VTADRSSPFLRLAGVLVLIGAAWYLPWMLRVVNVRDLWLSIPYVAASLLLIASTLLSWVNNWRRSAALPAVGVDVSVMRASVIVPTCGEPAGMVRATLQSIVAGSWPHDRLTIAVGDDASSVAMSDMVEAFAIDHADVEVLYYIPPLRSDPARRGAAKSGNLNAGLDELRSRGVLGELVETRDADDLVGDADFLLRCAELLASQPNLAFVQTLKEARVSDGDPFGNQEPLFYRGTMFARQASNAVFPCGSGVVWSARALWDISDFPTWNLVEDLQSGVEALRRGWDGAYLPIVGAIGQTAPEDLPNVYKQRGTWALDTMRLLIWGDLRGLTWRQRMQFYELGLFYLQSLSTLVFLLTPIIGLSTGIFPLHTDEAQFVLHLWPEAAAVELFLASLNRQAGFEALWRSRQMWAGLTFVHARAVAQAVRYGPHRKPPYQVTRKQRITGHLLATGPPADGGRRRLRAQRPDRRRPRRRPRPPGSRQLLLGGVLRRSPGRVLPTRLVRVHRPRRPRRRRPGRTTECGRARDRPAQRRAPESPRRRRHDEPGPPAGRSATGARR
jgi:cellulose synthase (UDP-forming)